jgi:hypothetical protein
LEIERVSYFKSPSFQDRIGSAADAKKKALEQLRSRPPVDEKTAAERLARSVARQARDEEKAAAKKAAQKAASDAKAAVPPPPTEAERKAARDARYAARKARK